MRTYTVIFYYRGVQTGDITTRSRNESGAIRRVLSGVAGPVPSFDQIYARTYLDVSLRRFPQ
jgi:hypothetical protein